MSSASSDFSLPIDTALWADARRVASAASPTPLAGAPIQQRRRRGFPSDTDNGHAAVQLVNDEGVLRWVYEAPTQRRTGARRAWRASVPAARDVVQRYEFPELGENKVTGALEALDLELNPVRGLRRWVPAAGAHSVHGAWQPIGPSQAAALKGRVLLLVHGTFSKSDMYNSELLAAPKPGPGPFQPTPGAAPVGPPGPGHGLWKRWTDPKATYGTVLAFDHATLSMAPWLNALMLAQALDGIAAPIDVVCHSRGGLVASWALRMSALPFQQIVFVGSPLMGTSLAAPNRLRNALDLLANVANAVSIGSAGVAALIPPAAPLALGAAGLSRVLGRVLQLGTAVPLADAVVGLVPGLLAQSRVANNLELRELALASSKVKLRGIGVAFKPNEVAQPAWKFWKRFSNLGAQAGYYVGDMLFQQPNDLVVDTDSMNQLGPKDAADMAPRLADAEWKFLGEKADTHHCSYFRDADAIAQLDRWLR